jgi:N-acetylglucosamine kinase-like BadF-type ATPase
MILIAGTGSICFAIDHFAHLYRTGGEGPFLGDLGSGTWIARQAIGRAQAPEASILRKIVCDHFKIDPQLKINQIELFNKYSNSEISALCFPICAAYTAGSQCVAPIIQAAADALHNLVLENYQKSNVQKLAFAGSLLTQTTPVRSLLEQRLADNLPQIQIYPAELSPLQGAVLNAYRHIHPQPNPAFIEKLKATFSHAPVQSVREKI